MFAKPVMGVNWVARVGSEVRSVGRGDLTDQQWRRIEPLLPAQKPRIGQPSKDHPAIINGILWVLRTGAPWRVLPRDMALGQL